MSASCVLVLAAGAEWESAALARIDAHPGLVVLRRCMDADDLMASATSGQADVALVALDAPGFDPACVEHLRRHGVRVVAVAEEVGGRHDVADRAARLDVAHVLGAGCTDEVPAALLQGEDGDTRARGARPSEAGLPAPEDAQDRGANRVVAVWGPAGAPGRTTLAVALAAELAARHQVCLLVDADPYGGAVAQHLGVLDEVSGLLQVSRLAGQGALGERWETAVRAVGTHLGVVTGLPRADRWREVRPAHLEQVVAAATRRAHVVLDTGFALEDEAGLDVTGRPGRNGLTLAGLEAADEVVVVGSADPVGLARLARGLVELEEAVPGAERRVVVNRMRPSLGWSERDVAAMVEGFVRAAGLHFLPDDRPAADRALVAGEAVVTGRDSGLSRGIAGLADALFPATVVQDRGRRQGHRSVRG